MLETPQGDRDFQGNTAAHPGNQQATQAEVGWLAGIIDGEGHIGISLQNRKVSRSVSVDLQIVNTDEALIEKVVSILRKLGVNPYIRERVHQKASWSTNWIVSLRKFAHVHKILIATRDMLTGLKREKADMVLALIESRMTKTRFDQYDEHERAIVDGFRNRFIGKCGASTTAREARRQYALAA